MASSGEFFIDRAMRLIARYLAAGRLQTVARGVENVPAYGPVLIVARHYHHLFDGLMFFAALPRRFHIVVTMDWVPNRRTKVFMWTINRLARWPMLLRSDALHRTGNAQLKLYSASDVRRYQIQAIRQAVELLVEERILIIFPEGYPTIDPTYTPKSEPDEFLPFKSGFINILRAAEARLGKPIPIIPAGIHYDARDIWTGYLTLGEAIYRDKFSDRDELIAKLEQEVKRLSEMTVATKPRDSSVKK
jgi:putative membrane protein